MKYIVGVKEVWEQCYTVEAENEDEARKKVSDNIFFNENEETKLLEDQFAFDHIDTNIDNWPVYKNGDE